MSGCDRTTGVAALIVAAGSGVRAGFEKTLAPLAGKSVLRLATEVFAAVAEVSKIVVVTTPDRIARAEDALDGILPKPQVVPGGAHRADSVRLGLLALGEEIDLVAVHDAARPLILPETILRCIEAARAHGAAAVGTPVTDTLQRADAKEHCLGPVDRRGLWAMQTPQVAPRTWLLAALNAAAAEYSTPTDETGALCAIGRPVALVDGGRENLKITFPGDLAFAEAILAARKIF